MNLYQIFILPIVDQIDDVAELKIEDNETDPNNVLKLPIHENRTEFKFQDMLVPWKLKESKQSQQIDPPIFLRYYHVFQEGELEQLCTKIEGIIVKKSFYDQGNWCVILKKII